MNRINNFRGVSMSRLWVGAFFCLASTAWADNGARCASLFSDQSSRATCVTILNLNSEEYSDDVLKDKISRMVHGVSFAELEAQQAKQDAELREATEDEEKKLLMHDQCHRLFADTDGREACKTLRMLSMRVRSDVQMVTEVRERLGLAPVSEEERLAIGRAEVDYKNSAAAIEYAEMQRRKAEEQQCARLYGPGEERKACDDLRMTSMRVRSDEQMRGEVADRVSQQRRERVDQEREQKKINRARAGLAAELDAKLRRGSTGFELLSWSLGGFGTVMQVRFILQNNTASTQKDFVVRCNTYGESGTQLNSIQKTLYQSLVSKGRRSFDLTLGFVNSQSSRAVCGIVKSIPG
jgi:hypothetical protein